MPLDAHGPRLIAVVGLAALAALAVAAAPAGGVAVDRYDERLPQPLYGYATATAGDTGYLVGGADENGTPVDAIHEVDGSGAPTRVASLPQPLIEPAAAAVGSTVYVFGGAQEPDEGLPQTTDTIYTYDTDTGEVGELVATSLPQDVSSAAAVPMNGDVYILGGLTIDQTGDEGQVDWLDTVWRFDPEGPSIETVDATLPTGRGQMAAVVTGDTALLFGGMAEPGEAGCPGENERYCPTDEVLSLDPGRPRVSPVGTLPDPVRWAAAALYEDTAYVMGGCRNACGPFEGTASIVAVDANTVEARELPVTMPDKGGRHGAVVLGDTALVPGGVRADGSVSAAHDRVRAVTLGATPPWAPGDLTAGPGEDATVELDWEAPPYDGGAPVTEYHVYRRTGAEAPERIARTADTAYVDDTGDSGTAYVYHVRAVNDAGAGTASDTAGYTPTDTPGVPAVSVRGGDAHLVVQWDPPEDDGGSPITGYRVLAYPAGVDASGCEEASCRDLQAGVGHFELTRVNGTDVQNGETYAAEVQARNEHGWGPTSEPIEATARPAPDAPTKLRIDGRDPAAGAVNLTWKASFEADGYVVYRGSSVGDLEQIGTSGTLRFTDEGVPRGVSLVYAVAGTDDEREGPLSKTVRTVFPEPPGPVRNLTSRWEAGEAVVTWRAPGDLGGAALDGYDVARTRGAMDPEQGNGTPTRVSETVFRDGAAPRGQQVTYYVRAVTPGGEGPWELTQLRVPGSGGGPPDAVLSARPGNPDPGQRVLFDASGSTDDSGVAMYRFDVGDGSEASWQSSPRATHVYEQEGVYTATLEVRDVDGKVSKPATATIAVGSPQDEPPANETPPEGPDPDDTPVPAWAPLAAMLAVAALVRRKR